MPTLIESHTNLSVLVASLCGALVWVMTQRYFNRKKQPVVFAVSFVMGILGADVTLEIIKTIVPGIFSDEKAIGAFFCSALVITLITNLIQRVSTIQINDNPKNK
ncbi:hypothetical protein ERD95_09210 [Enterobacteriaceae bacterium ML5]|nr:hypothetical protein ERD95_09210 [Enterobacteriaceae bacterium ML5]